MKSIITVGLVFCFLLSSCRKGAVQNNEAINSSAKTSEEQHQIRLLSDNADFLTAYSNPPGSTDDLLKEFSPKYRLAFEEITEKVASISNPELREAQIAELWLTKDRGGIAGGARS